MKLLGLIGGTGWISTVEYYRIINEETNRRLGGLQFARCALYSLNYGDINEMNERGDVEGQYALMRDAARKLISIGAGGILLCANTLHQFADRLQGEIPVPLVHIATATTRHIKNHDMSVVGLLGTKYTMEMDFYKKKMEGEGIRVLVPEQEERVFIHTTIYDELLKGVFRHESRSRFVRIMDGLHVRGAQGIILGCTEIPLLVSQKDTALPLFDTLRIHSLAAVDFALEADSPHTAP